MINIPFANKQEYQFPIVLDYENNTLSHISAFKNLIRNYSHDLLHHVKAPTGYTDEAVFITIAIMDIHELLLTGNHSAAYRKFNEMSVFHEKDKTGFPILEVFDNVPFFRIRKNDRGLRKKSDLFHIPFESREKISTKRFSAPGIPFLYLGVSLYDCWIELGQPAFSSIQFARFQVPRGKSIKLVDLRFDLQRIAKLKDDETALNMLKWWPLLAALSVCRRHERADFHEEYILPHLFTEQCLERKKFDKYSYDGILYLSSSRQAIGDFAQQSNEEFSLLTNVVLFTRELADKGMCSELTKKIYMTDPHSWQFISATTYPLGFSFKYHESISGTEILIHGVSFGASNDKSYLYTSSQFYEMEKATKRDGSQDNFGPVSP